MIFGESNLNILKRIKNIIYRKFAWWCINKRYAGCRKFKLKRQLLIQAGYKIGENTKIVGPMFVSAELEIGNNCFIGKDFQAQGNGKIKIEDNCDIGPNVIINTGGHNVGTKERRAGEGLITNITIGSGTWVGLRSTILNNTIIGKNNVIAAGSVVINSSNDNVLLAGVPAKEKKVYENLDE